MVEEYAKSYEKVIKKNFATIFILSILKDGPSHGYEINNKIRKRTLGIWNPTASTLYWILKKQREMGLIKLVYQKNKIRNKQVYEITDKGKETLRLMKKSQNKIRKVYKHFLSLSSEHIFPFDSEELEYFDNILNYQLLSNIIKPEKENLDLSPKKKLHLLNLQKETIIVARDRLNDYIKKINEIILNIKKELEDSN